MNALSRLLLVLCVLVLVPQALALPGDLDASFGTNGKVTTPVGAGDDRGQAVALQSDGKVVVAGYSYNGSNNDFCVVRYNVDGSLDDGGPGDSTPSDAFGIGGKVVTDFGFNDTATGVAVQPDGKIVVVGGSLNPSTSVYALARYNTDGTLDSTGFGLAGTGRVTTAASTSYTAAATAVRLQPDGKICVSGAIRNATGRSEMALLRYNSNGTLDDGGAGDTTPGDLFGTGGLKSFGYGGGEAWAHDLLVQADGSLALVGFGQGDYGSTLIVTRFSTSGTLLSYHSNFNNGGNPSTFFYGFGAALQADGRMVVVGRTGNSTGQYDMPVVRYLADVSGVDTSFGSNGAVITSIGTAEDVAYDVALQPDGRVVVAGYSYSADTGFNDFAVVRYQTDGSPDTSFKSTGSPLQGKVRGGFTSGNAVGRGVVIAPDGRILVAGYARNGANDDIALIRLYGSGSLATTAPAHGTHTNNNTPVISGTATAGFTVNVQVDGSVIGTTVADGNGAWNFTPALALTDGTHTAAATETDGFGSTGPLSNAVSFTVDTAAPAAPVITSPTEGTLVSTTWPVISGTAEAGATVTVQMDGATVGTAVAGNGGVWSFTPVNALTGGLHSLRVFATDRAGNPGPLSSAVSFSTIAPLLGGPGTFDASFGTGGKVLTAVGSGEDRGHAVALQSDGKAVVAGYSYNGSNNDFAVVRYNVNGTLDSSFNGTGKVTTDFGFNDTATGVAVQPDGKIVVVGGSLNISTGGSVYALARYNTDGTLDSTGFGLAGTGRVTTAVGISGGGATSATAVRLQADGKICVSGALSGASGREMALLRYNSNGTLDTGFGIGGLVRFGYGGGQAYAHDVLVQADGSIALAGYGQGDYGGTMIVSRFSTSGSLLTYHHTFNNGGNPSTFIYGFGAALQADGRMVVVGRTGNSTGQYDMPVVRYLADGSGVDTSFGTNGAVITSIGTAEDVAYDVALQPDGRVVVTGYSYNADTGFNDFAVVRYQANGALDTSFKSTGKLLGGFTGGNAVGRGVVIAPDGRILVAGHARNGSNDDFALIRLYGSGSLATTAPAHGTHTNNNTPAINGTATAGFTVNVQVDGSVIGTTVVDGNGAWSFTPAASLADGVHTAAATETDGFGSTGQLSNAVSFTVDTAAPAAPVITSPVEGTLVNTTWPLISGTAEAGATVTVQMDGATVGTTVAGTGGSWSFTPVNAWAGGLHSVRSFATDRAGNAGPLSAAVSFSTIAPLLGGPGTFDASFGTGGKVLTAVGSGEDRGHAVALQSDGKAVVAGYSYNGSNNDFAVVRYNVDGTLDSSFNGTGKVVTDFGFNDTAAGVSVQPDGKIVVVGGSLNTSTGTSVYALARYNTDGTLDSTGFGLAGTGRVTTAAGIATGAIAATAVRLQPGGKICVSGAFRSAAGHEMALLRYNSDGTLDTEFGTGGLARFGYGGGEAFAHDVLVQADGSIALAGYGVGAYDGRLIVTRFSTSGTILSYHHTFNNAGNPSTFFYGFGAALQADGRMVVVGRTGNSAGQFDMPVVRYLADVSGLDTSFGSNGAVFTSIGTAEDVAYDVALQPDGRVVVAGYSYNADTGFNDFAVVRYQANGTLDTSFKSTGKLLGGFTSGNAVGRGVVIAPDGRILVAGHARNGANDDFALIRLFGTDQPPIVTTGDATGIVRNGAVLNGTVNPNSLATTAYFEYGTTTGYGSTSSSVNLGNGYLAAPTAITIGGLTDNTLYHYRLVATNAAGTTYGADATFTTAPNPPLAFTGDAANVSASGATLVGTVLPNGRDTTAYFEFGLTTAYGAQTSSQLVPAAGTIENIFAPLTGLVAGATYHFRLVAVNAGSPIPITGVDKTFVAQAPPPLVTISAALPISTNSVSLGGTVNANGASTQVFFDYGLSSGSLTQSVSASPASVSGAANVPVGGTLSGLSQGVTYYYRLRAVSPGGTAVSETLALKLDLLLGLTRVFPTAPPESEGFITVNLLPAGILHGWRFVGEQQWRPSGVPVAGLTTSDREIEFRPVPGHVQPEPEPVSIVSGEAALYSYEYITGGNTGSGDILVTLKPSAITTAQWRLLGETEADWRNSDAVLTGLPPGNYLIECKPVAGRATPANVNVTVTNGQTASVTITYFLPDAATGTPPAVLSFESVSADTTRPYAHVGQFRSQVGSSSGFVVKPRVVATAAHVVWDDGRVVDNGSGGPTLAAVQGLQWLFQRYRGVHEPVPVVPRGFYTFDGYAAQRIADNSPGDSSPASQHLDVAAVYFSTNAGRGGYSGFLASDLAQNEFLLSNANKMLVGYPVDGISNTSQGRMHAAAPSNVVFSSAFGRTFTTTSIRSSGGNSGGPLCVQFEGGAYYPAAIYLGGDDQTVVRAIDSEVVDLFNRAEISSNGGDNNTGGGITHTSISGTTSSTTGSVQVNIEPAAARTAGAGWRLGTSGTYRVSGAIRSSVTPGSYTLSMTTVAGFDAPNSPIITVSGGELTAVTYTYAAPMNPQESWRQTFFGTPSNSGDAADTFDFDGDGFTNAQEYAAGTNPTLSGDFFKAENAQRSGNSFTVSTTGKAGRTYTLERSATLSGWSGIVGATQGPLASDGPVTLTDSAAAGGAFFYRIRVTGP